LLWYIEWAGIFQDPGCDAEVEAEYIELVEYLSNGGSYEVDSGTSSACPTKMGEGGNGSYYCFLPKELVRSKEESLKLNLTQEKAMNLEQPIISITGVVDKREVLPLQDPALEN